MLGRNGKTHPSFAKNWKFNRSRLRRLYAAAAPTIEMLEARRMLSISGFSLGGAYLIPGASFTLAATGSNGTTGTLTYDVVGSATAPSGQSSVDLESTIEVNDNSSSDSIYIGSTSAGIVEYADDDGSDTDTYTPPEIIMPANLSAGQPIGNTSTDTDTSDSDDTIESQETDAQTFTLVSETPSPLTVPAGTFNSYEIQYSETDTDGDPNDTSTTSTDIWWAPNVGIVQEEGSAEGDITITYQLESYFVPQDTLQWVAQPAANTPTGDTMAPVSVEFLDANGNVDTNETGAITLALQGGTGALGGNTTVDAVNGVATFNSLSVNLAGNYTLDASSSDTSDVISNSFQITGEHLVFTSQPTGAAPNTQIPLVVSVDDSNNTVDVNATGTITLSLNTISGGDGAALTGTTFAPIVNGQATFTDPGGPAINVDGEYTLTANQTGSDSPAANATSNQFSIANSLTWTGSGNGTSWSDAKNWSEDVAPVSGDSLVFASGGTLLTNNDITGLSVANIDIQGAGYTLGGNAISLTGGLTSESGNNTYDIATTLVGSPTIDDQAGDLTIESVLSGASLTVSGAGIATFDDTDTYTGTTTLAAGVTIDDSAASDAFGDGDLVIGAGSSAVSIDDTGSGAADLDNDVSLQDGSTISIDPTVEFTGDLQVNGASKIETANPTDTVDLNGSTLQGTGTIIVSGEGHVTLSGDVAPTVQIQVSGGELDLSGNLTGTGNQLTVNGGTVVLATSMGGTGGIDMQFGTLTANGEAGYSGTVTLENYQPAGNNSSDIINLAPSTDPLGTGSIVINSPANPSASSVIPTLSNSALVGAAVELDNPIVIQSSANLAVTGNFNFGGLIFIQSSLSNLNGDTGGATLNFNGGFGGTGELNFAANDTVNINAAVPVSVALGIGAANGVLDLNSSLNGDLGGASQIMVTAGTVQLTSTTTGNGGIDLQSGIIASSGAPGYGGYISVETPYAAGQSTTLNLSGASALGTGQINFKAPAEEGTPTYPTLINTAGATALVLNNPVSIGTPTVNFQGATTFGGNVTFTGNETLALAEGAGLNFTNTMSGTGTVSFSMNTNTSSLTGPVVSTLAIAVTGGTLNIGGELQAASGTNQVFVSGGGNLQMLNTISGNGGIDIQSGTLIAGGAPGYGGIITVETPQTGLFSEVIATTATSVLGTGQLIFSAPSKTSGTTGPYLADGSSTTSLTIDTPVVFQGTTVNTLGTINFAGPVTVTGNNTLSAPNGSNLAFTGTMSGTGTVAFSMTTNTLSISGTIAAGTAITVNGTLPVVELSGTLSGTTGNQIDVQTGNIKLLSGFNGTGNIELDAGELNSSVSLGDNFSGNITLSQGSTVQDIVNVAPAVVNVLGTGQLIATASGATTLSPELVNTTGSAQTVTLANQITFQGSSSILSSIVPSLSASGAFVFSGQVNLSSFDYFLTTATSDVDTFTGTIAGTGSLLLNGPGTFYIQGNVNAGSNVGAFGLTTTGTGTLVLDGTLLGSGNQVTLGGGIGILEGQNSKLPALTGTGGIDDDGATLTSDQTSSDLGPKNYSGPITVEAGGVAIDYDSVDFSGFGSGTMTLNGGTLQNAVPKTENATVSGVLNPIVSIGTSTIAAGATRFKLEGPLLISSGNLTFSGDVALLGGLSGTGNIALQTTTDTLEVAGSNTGYTGKVSDNGGTIIISANNSLGSPNAPTNSGFLNFFAAPITNQTSNAGKLASGTIADPVVDNPIVVENGTLVLEGLLTFPAGITVDAGAAIEIEGAGSDVVTSGALTGAGTIIVDAGTTFSTPGGTSGFTGTISQGTPTLVTPTLTVSDAGGVANGSSYPATATLSASGVTPTNSLEGVSPTFTYYTGTSTTGVGTSAAPDTTGTYTVVGSFAGSTDYAPVVSTPVTFIITPAPATSKLAFFVEPRTTEAGWLGPVVVFIENSKGKLATSDDSTVTLSVATGPGNLHGQVSVRAFHGVAIFWNLYLTTAGTYTLKATDGSDTSALTHSFKITPAAPARLVFVDEPNSTGAGDQIGPVVVDVEDQYGNLETGFNSTVTLFLETSGHQGILSGTTRVRAVDGVATFSNLSVSAGGTYRLEAFLDFCAADSSNPFTISPAPPPKHPHP
jgi:hypothetical protein